MLSAERTGYQPSMCDLSHPRCARSSWVCASIMVAFVPIFVQSSKRRKTCDTSCVKVERRESLLQPADVGGRSGSAVTPPVGAEHDQEVTGGHTWGTDKVVPQQNGPGLGFGDVNGARTEEYRVDETCGWFSVGRGPLGVGARGGRRRQRRMAAKATEGFRVGVDRYAARGRTRTFGARAEGVGSATLGFPSFSRKVEASSVSSRVSTAAPPNL